MKKKIKRLFIANRGEIALRIIKACKGLNIETVIGVSEADRDSLPAKLADQTICIGPAQVDSSYLRAELLITAAKGAKCDAVHPGYGFLAEQASFSRLCAENDLIFVGPNAKSIEVMGDKLRSIRLAKKAGVLTVPSTRAIQSKDRLMEAVKQLGYPCLLKASSGGGGRGMRVVHSEQDLVSAYESAKQEAFTAFGNNTVYLEKYIENAKHIEIQIIADQYGNYAHLYERECSVQRRYQKLIEEAPSSALDNLTRNKMIDAALRVAKKVQYVNVGTVEFIYDLDTQDFYFLEMNTRIQVEHPVTENITGIDIVKEQIKISSGEVLNEKINKICIDGHSIECRINAEDPDNNFIPTPGKITRWIPPSGKNIRLDSHCYEGYSIPPYYDSLMGKLIVHANTREQAINKMLDALNGFVVNGPKTTISLISKILSSDDFKESKITTNWLEKSNLI